MAPPLALDSPVTELPRLSAADARRLARLGVATVRDLLLHLPFEFDSYEEVASIAGAAADARAMVMATLVSIHSKTINSGRHAARRQLSLSEATLRDDRGQPLKVVWFHKPYLAHQLRPGDRLALAGRLKPSRFGPGLEMQNPDHEVVGIELGPRRLAALMPRYHLTAGLTSKRLSGWVEAALPLAGGLEDLVPPPTRERHRLLPVAEAVRQGHRPQDPAELAAAKRRLVFAELLELQAAFLLARRRMASEQATPVEYRQEVIDAFLAGLQFEMTGAQKRSAWEVFKDLRGEVPMNRLLNGDVGSGKTAVAAAAVAMVHAAGLQSLVMAPTEILARQHLDRFRAHLEASFPGLAVELLVSGVPAAERRRVLTAAASGHCAVLVGTHALLEQEVTLARLGLAVVDEQHRFGTRQRELLRAKAGAGRPHFLAMTATPIPRTLALALYGEMALSTIDEMPPGRLPVATQVLMHEERDRAYRLVRSEVAAGRQAFVICPLIEESETQEARAATVEFERLRGHVFGDLRMALVHGRMRDKDSVMRAFRAGASDVLVATSVVEVGVDVPNATVMLIEGAERFGLAQLHQLRGRVGRGAARSHCILLVDQPSPPILARLRLLEAVHDGFRLASEDMRLRGMGEMLGPRQHGMSDLAMEALQNPELLSEVRQEAELLIDAEAGLEQWPPLREAAARRLDRTSIS